MNILVYIGKTLLNRPILLVRARNALFSQIKDTHHLGLYACYFFEIYMQEQM